MKIYTRTGDNGKTSLFTGERTSKDALRIICIGTIDELNAAIGVVVSQLKNTPSSEDTAIRLRTIQRKLFTTGSSLANSNLSITQEDINNMEASIDYLTDHLPTLNNFILPGGSQAASSCHLARTICRRCGRLLVTLNNTESIDPLVLQFFNRLSDYLFTIARAININEGTGEIIWNRHNL